MKTVVFSAAAALVAFAPTAVADPGFYVNGGVSVYDGDGATLEGLTGRAGYDFNDYFGVEGEFSIGLGEENVDGIDLEINNQYAAYAVGKLPISERFDIFGRIGYGTIEFEGSAGGISETVDVDGFGFGAGGQFFFSENVGVRGEYTRFEADDEDGIDGELDVFTVSAVIKF